MMMTMYQSALRKIAYAIYKEFFSNKNKISLEFSFNIFNICVQNIDCWYTLEPPRPGGSNEYPQSIFLNKIKKRFIPVNPSFTIGMNFIFVDFIDV